MQKVKFDGGGFAMFPSYHDVKLPPRLVGRSVSDYKQFKYAFDDLVKALDENPNWRENFSPGEVVAIQKAKARGGPRIEGFCWHHHQDHGWLQLVSENDHRAYHHGGRFITGGRPK